MFSPLVAADAVFRQPLFPAGVGPDGFARSPGPLFELLPDLVLDLQRCSAHGDTVFIESTCTGTLGRTTVHFDVCDCFVLRDGLIAGRTTYSDPTALFGVIARHPSAWSGALRLLPRLFSRHA